MSTPTDTIFDARYHSTCSGCEQRIEPGDQVRWDSGDVVHVDCSSQTDLEHPTREPCPRCFMVPAVNGLCGCDE